MKIAQRAEELGHKIPEVANASNQVLAGKIVNSVLYVSGSTALVDGKLPYVGSVGNEITLEQAQECSIIAFVNCLAKAKAIIGDLSRIKQIIKVTGFVASAPGFYSQAIVMNAASQFCIDLFGVKGQHTRTACGIMALPGGSPVEVEIIAELFDN